ncbi:MAG TPA: amidohydrolase family protein [Candidatus Acidoferrum sp.]|nr:amidohydrolase family protein [Candidatus Acidoferrum sp.]
MKIDAHQHFWKYDPQRDAWITPEMAAIRRDFLPQDLDPELRANGIDATIAVQAAQSEDETRFLLELADSRQTIAGVVGWVDLRAENLRDRLEHFSRFAKLRGFRHAVQAEPDGRFLLREEFLRGVRMLREFGFTYDILIYPRQLEAALEFARRLPGQKLVIDHLAKPEIRGGAIREWAAQMRAMAAIPHVWCKVSGMVTEADWKKWRAEDFRPYLDIAFECFGAERLMFGSDWPVCLVAASYGQVKHLVENYAAQCNDEQRDALFGGNAARFYGIETADGSAA